MVIFPSVGFSGHVFMEDIIISICLCYIRMSMIIYTSLSFFMEKHVGFFEWLRHGHCDFVLDGQYVRPLLPGR